MLTRDGNKPNKLEELKNKLSSRNYRVENERRDTFPHFEDQEVSDSWVEKDSEDGFKEKFFMKTSMFKKFFIFSLIFFLLAMGYASYVFFARGNTVSNDNIDISVLSNAFTAGGEEFPLLLEIINRNNLPLQFVDLLVEYPKSLVSGSSQENEHIRLSLGTIPAGGIKNENVKFAIFGEQGSIRQIKISLEYRVEGSNAIFVKEKYFDVTVNSTPLNLVFDAPQEASSNQDIVIKVKAALNATKPAASMLLRVDYPVGFQFAKASPSPSLGNNIWSLGDFAPGAERDISITGKMIDVADGEEKVFRITGGSQSVSDKSVIGVVFNSAEHLMRIKRSAMDIELVINGESDREYAIDSKSRIEGQIKWKNNLETMIGDLEIRARVTGNALNRKTISTRDGFYDSSGDVIIWDRNSLEEFEEVGPGNSGVVNFSLSPLPLFTGSGGIMSSPSINIDVFVDGRSEHGGGEVAGLSGGLSKTVKVISEAGLSAKALHYSGSFENTGPVPPKADEKTTYTVVFSLTNTANNISKTKVTAELPPWVEFTGNFSPESADFIYDKEDREVTWNVGTLGRGTGVSNPGREISFQIELTPSLSQVGDAPTLVRDITLTGHDDFANVPVQVTKNPLDTKLVGDTEFPADGARVVE